MDDNRILTNKIFKQKINELVGADVIELEAANDDLALNCKIFEAGMDAIKELIINDGSNKELYLHAVSFKIGTNSAFAANIYTASNTKFTSATLYSYFESLAPSENGSTDFALSGSEIKTPSVEVDVPCTFLHVIKNNDGVSVKINLGIKSSGSGLLYSMVDVSNSEAITISSESVIKIL